MRWGGFRKVRGQVCKRISRRYRELGLASLAEYRSFLEDHPDEWPELDRLCRVTISRFYRDRGVFDQLRDHILPEVASRVNTAGRSSIRVWSCGCASGEEAYSVSMCFRRGAAATTGVDIEIVGTDTDAHMLERADSGVFPPGALRDLPVGWLEGCFESHESGWRIREPFRAGISWQLQDIRREAPPGLFDLILCRNLVFMYYDNTLRRACTERMLAELHNGGYLVIGNHDLRPGDIARVRPVDSSRTIFKKWTETLG
jgi:chemotaxis protein methyltransferase CheR